MKHLTTLIKIIPIVLISCSNLTRQVKTYPDCTSSDIEQNDTCLLGQTIRASIEKLSIDTSNFFAFDEPPGILRGIYIKLADTCIIRLYVERTSIINKQDSVNFRENYKYLLDNKIIGVAWKKDKRQKRKSLGSVIGYLGD